jgi:tetratricopeptide (TPR) repeat protein
MSLGKRIQCLVAVALLSSSGFAQAAVAPTAGPTASTQSSDMFSHDHRTAILRLGTASRLGRGAIVRRRRRSFGSPGPSPARIASRDYRVVWNVITTECETMTCDFSLLHDGKGGRWLACPTLAVPLRIVTVSLIAFWFMIEASRSSEVMNSMSAKGLYEQGLRFEHQGLKLLAVECFDLARKKEPNTYIYHRVYMRAAHQIGANRLMKKEYESDLVGHMDEAVRLTILSRLNEYEPLSALDLASKAAERAPDASFPLNATASAYSFLQDYKRSHEVLQQAYAKNPKDPETLAALGINSLEMGRGEIGYALLDRAAEDPYYGPYVLSFKGRYLIRDGHEHEGLETLNRAIALHPYLGLPYMMLGDHRLAQKDTAQALAYYRKGVSLNMEDALFLNNAAWFAITEAKTPADLSEGLIMAERAATFSNFGDPQIIDTLAEAYYRVGEKQKALTLIDRALGLPYGDKAYFERQKSKFSN